MLRFVKSKLSAISYYLKTTKNTALVAHPLKPQRKLSALIYRIIIDLDGNLMVVRNALMAKPVAHKELYKLFNRCFDH